MKYIFYYEIVITIEKLYEYYKVLYINLSNSIILIFFIRCLLTSLSYHIIL